MCEQTKCTECGAYHGHSPWCSLIDLETAKKDLIMYHQTWLEMETNHRKYADGLYKVIEKKRKEAEFWKGKFMVVKHENNKLRKKLK